MASQCKPLIIRVIWLHLDVFVIIRAAVFRRAAACVVISLVNLVAVHYNNQYEKSQGHWLMAWSHHWPGNVWYDHCQEDGHILPWTIDWHVSQESSWVKLITYVILWTVSGHIQWPWLSLSNPGSYKLEKKANVTKLRWTDEDSQWPYDLWRPGACS